MNTSATYFYQSRSIFIIRIQYLPYFSVVYGHPVATSINNWSVIIYYIYGDIRTNFTRKILIFLELSLFGL